MTARLRPNPLLTLDADHLDWLGTHFNQQTNNGGPTEYSVRGDYLYERGGKRQARTALAVGVRDVTRLGLADSVRGLIQSVQSACVDVGLGERYVEAGTGKSEDLRRHRNDQRGPVSRTEISPKWS